MRHFLYLGFILLSLCGCKETTEPSSEGKPLVLITSPDNPPFEFKDTGHGGDKVIGFDMDVAHNLAQRLGRPLQIVEMDFSSIIPALQSGRADMAMAGFTVTDERSKSVDFSDPYYTFKLAFLLPENSPIKSEKNLHNLNLGVQLGTSHEILAKRWQELDPTLSLKSLTKIGELVQDLKNGRIQAILIEETTARNIVAATPGLKVLPLESKGEDIAIAFPKGSPWVTPTNEALKEMKSDIHELTQKWMAP